MEATYLFWNALLCVSLSKRYAAPPDSYTVLELQSLQEDHVSPNAMQMSWWPICSSTLGAADLSLGTLTLGEI